MESRFSLNEQFATTRRDFEFDDAASSIWERSTTAEGEGELDDTLVVIKQRQSASPVLKRSHYELLCLPESTELQPEEIRKAYLRMVQILLPERQPQHLVPMAQQLLGDVQMAFETLIEPYKRAGYDLSAQSRLTESEGSIVDEAEVDISDETPYGDALRDAYLSLAQGEMLSSTDIGLRLDARRNHRKHGTLEPLDLHLEQSMTLTLPTLHIETPRESTQEKASEADDVKTESLSAESRDSVMCAVASVTITGGIHGFVDDPNRHTSLLQAGYQPPGPSVHGQRALEQLTASRFLPVFSVILRQDLYKDKPQKMTERPTTVLEQQISILPEPAITGRIGHPFVLPSGNPLNLELCVQKFATESHPMVGMALHRRLPNGTAFIRLDAGDWTLRPAEECRQFSKFSQATKRFVQARNPFRNAPTVEVGYTVSPYELGLAHGRSLTKPAGQRIGTMDTDMDLDPAGSWTVSVGATADTLAGYLRYGRDIFTSHSPSQTAVLLPPGTPTRTHTGLRTEIELSTTSPWPTSPFLAFRTLRRITRSLSLGFEVGLSPSNLHLSLYLSRLNQRISIPLLLSTTPTASLVFWATLIPFLGLAASSLLARHPKPAPNPRSREDLQQWIAARRSEADTLTVLLSSGVEPRQRMERQNAGLVILSAKYSVLDAPSEEVADVTVAVAALVDRSEVRIPRGLRKGRLLGFWDPSPGEKKVLTVRYLSKGKEGCGRWEGREEVRIGGDVCLMSVQ